MTLYDDHLTGLDKECALNTLGELVNIGALDGLMADLSERQLEVAWKVHALWSKQQEE